MNRLYRRLTEHVTPSDATTPTAPTRRRPDQWSVHRIRRVHELCAAAWARQIRVGYLHGNPFAAAGKPPVERSRPRFPTTKQVGMLIAAADRLAVDWSGDRRRNPSIAAQLPAYIRLLAMTGARKGELVALRWQHVHLDQHPATLDIFESLSYGSTGGTVGKLRSTRRVGLGTGITVRQTKTGSAGQRTISLDETTAAMLTAILTRRGDQDPDQFVLSLNDDGGVPWQPGYAGRMFSKVRVVAGLGWIDGHHLRHWHATQRLDAGEPAVLVAQRLGHSDATTTQRIYRYAGAGVDAPGTDRLAETLAEAEWDAHHPDEAAYRDAVWAGIIPRRRSLTSQNNWARSLDDETTDDRWVQEDAADTANLGWGEPTRMHDPWLGVWVGTISDTGHRFKHDRKNGSWVDLDPTPDEF